MTRTRTRNTIVELASTGHTTVIRNTAIPGRTFVGWFYNTAGETQLTDAAAQYIIGSFTGVTGVDETITDVVGSPGTFNYCYHTKVQYDAPIEPVELVGALLYYNQPSQVVEGEARSTFGIGVSKGLLDQHAFYGVPFLASDEQMLAEAASKCNPAVVKPHFDVSQQLGELLEGFRSIKHGLETIGNIQRDIERLNRWNSPAVRRLLGKRTFSQLSMTDWASLATNAHLGYTLAVKPLVVACKQLRKAIDDYESVISGYQASEEVYHGVSRREDSSYITGSTSAEYFVHGLKAFTKEVHATVRVRYGANKFLSLTGGELVYPRSGRAKFDAAYYGLTPSVATAWALSPFSFIVDWFTGFGSVLSQWSETAMPELEYEILETGWSVKTTADVQLYLQPCTGPYTKAYGSVKAATPVGGTITSEQYKRETKSFDPTVFTPSPPQFKLPSLDKAITLAELLFQLARGRKDSFRVERPGS
jgi:hypothetical protein